MCGVAVDWLLDFSRTHCLAICVFLVPANLIATLQTLLFTGFNWSVPRRCWMAIAASFYALVMVGHVMSWWLIGVVMAPTYILLSLALVCLGLNGGAIAFPAMQKALQWLIATVQPQIERRMRRVTWERSL
jgi:hypothetical protein